MAINFPSSPADGEEYTDPNSGTWVYDIGTNSWTLTAAGSANAFNFRGGHDFTQSTPPAAPIESGDMWIHDGPDGTIDAVYTGISGQIDNGQLVLWDGSRYVMVSNTMPGYPDVGDGEGGTLDSRYLKLGANAGAQTVLSTNETNFRGNVVLGDANDITLDAAAGSASFAGNVVSSASNFSTAGCQLGQNGGISARRVIGSDLQLFQGWNGSTSTVAIFQSGNAEFAGDVETKTGFTLKGGAVSHRIGTGTYWHTSVATSKYIISTGVAPLGDTIATFTPDGNLELKGNVTFNLEPDNNANYTVTTETYEEQEELTPYVPAVPATYDEEGNELTAEVPAVEATYQTVTKTREIRTYTGPTLDVKERLQNLLARVDAMEANEVIDDATDSSLLTLVSNLDTRLNGIEARIAALEAA